MWLVSATRMGMREEFGGDSGFVLGGAGAGVCVCVCVCVFMVCVCVCLWCVRVWS
jgi:hypothetical protein